MADKATYDDLTLSDVTVKFDGEGEPQKCHAGFAVSSGMAFFDIDDGTAQYDGHVHSVDREKAETAVSNLPFIDSVNMDYNPRGNE